MTDATQADREAAKRLLVTFTDEWVSVFKDHRQQAEADTAERIAAWMTGMRPWQFNAAAIVIRRGDWRQP